MLNMDQTQRRDIDTTLDDRLTLAIDEENIADNPYIFEPTSFVGNNWFKQGSNIVKLNLAEQDSLIFLSSPLVKLLQKDITNVIVSFDYQVSNVSVNYPILSNISLTCMEMTNYMLVENILTTQGHIDVDCSLFNFSSNVVNTSISEQGFKVGINFNGNKSNATIKLSNVQIQFKYRNKLATQEDSVVNRLEPHIDFYRDEDGDLVLQIGGDASGKGMDHSGGDIDTYSKTEIDNKLATKVNVEIGKGLSSNDYTLTEKTKLASVETNANYYVHPSSHQTGIITEESALTNLETSANATQHEINLAIDSKINSGGGSVDWSDIQNKPSDYPPSSHNHDDRYYTESEIDTALSNKVSKSSTSGLLKNDGTVDTSSYITSSALSNYVQKSNTTGLLKNDGTVDTTSYSTFSGSYNDLSNKPTIPTKISDLTNDSDFIEKSNTNGLVKNDGTIDTSTYLTSSALSNYVQKSSTNGLLKNDGTVDTTSYSTFSGSYNDLSNKPSIPSSSSDLSDGSDLIKKSSTSGLLKNDGTVDTTSYSTFSGSYNDLSNKPSIPSSSSDLSDGSDLVKKSNTSGLLKNDGSVDTTQYLSSLPSHNHDDRYYTESEVDTALNGKQDTLVSGTNIKTVNNQSLLGSGNIVIQGGGTGVDIATSWGNPTSDSKVPSEKLAKDTLDGKANVSHTHTKSEITDFPSIPSKTSDLNNDSGFITSSSLPTKVSDLQNDTGFITSSALPTKTSDLTNDGADGTNVFVANNDSRLSDARTPTSHTHTSNQVSDLIDTIYPIGSIYMSVNTVNPSTLFGGTWEQIKDTFLLSSGDTYNNGATGGNADAVVVSHTHTQNAHSHTLDNSKNYVVASNNAYAEGVKRLSARDNNGGYYLRSDYASSITVYTNTSNATATNQTTGESGTGKNMPPYLVVNVWKRTA